MLILANNNLLFRFSFLSQRQIPFIFWHYLWFRRIPFVGRSHYLNIIFVEDIQNILMQFIIKEGIL